MNNHYEWVSGTVEDNVDPEAKSRVRVRLDGYHTQLNEHGDMFGIPTSDLDWYPVLMPPTSSSRGGVGHSPSGLRIGDRVMVLLLDEFKQSALVMGTIHGDGDVSDLAVGGIDGLNNESVVNQNRNLSKAPMLYSGEYDRDVIEVDDVGFKLFFRALEFDEGFRDKPYYDQHRLPHIGIGTLLIHQYNYPLSRSWQFVERRLGRKIPERVITYNDAVKMAMDDIRRFEAEIQRFPQLALAYNSVSQTRKYGLLMMCYQMGTGGVAGFKNSLNMIINEDWDRAYRNLKLSAWANQTPKRANRVATVIRDNNFSVYPASVRNKAKGRNLLRVDNELEFDDLTDLQLYVIDNTRQLRSFTQVSSLEDMHNLLDNVLNYRDFIKAFKNVVKGMEELVQSTGDINVVEYISKYINSFKRTIKRIIDDVVKFITNTASEVAETFKKTAELIKALANEIIFRIDGIIQDISNIVIKLRDNYSEEIVETEESGVLFAEPPYEYAGEYPYVKTDISESGHRFEVDDTPGFERIREEHRTGTYREIGSSGRIVEKSVADKYLFVDGDDHIFIEGNGKITIGGNHIINIIGDSTQIINGNVKQVVRGESYIENNGNVKILNLNDSEIETKGNTKLTCEGSVDALVKGPTSLRAEDYVDAEIMGETQIHLHSDALVSSLANVKLEVEGNLTTVVDGNHHNEIKGNLTFNTTGQVGIFGSRINLGRS